MAVAKLFDVFLVDAVFRANVSHVYLGLPSGVQDADDEVRISNRGMNGGESAIRVGGKVVE